MGNWKKEGFGDFDVPSIVDFLVGEGFLEDASWKNDTSPRFIIPDPDNEERGIGLWVQHPLKGFREADGGRFIVEEGEISGESETSFDTDDLEEAILKIFELVNAEKYLTHLEEQFSWYDPQDPKYSLQEAAGINSESAGERDPAPGRGRGGTGVPRHTCGDKCRSYGCRFGDRDR